MTFDLDPVTGPLGEPAIEPQPAPPVTERMISLRFIGMALRRKRRLWLGLGLVGLIAGLGFHIAVPPKYTATSTVYLAHVLGSDDGVDSLNDLAMLQTGSVGQRAIDILHEPNLTPATLLGKLPGVAESDNILTISIPATTPQEAVRRVNAVTTAYLSFRSEEYNAQNDSVTGAAQQQITKLQTQLAQLTTQIDALGPAAQGQEYTNLVDQQGALSAQILNLQQTVQTDNLNTLSVTNGSRVLTAGTVLPLHKARILALDGMSGLVGALGLGVLIVIVQAVLTDRLWRREDIAAVLGVPVDLSIGRLRRRTFRRSVARLASSPPPELQTLVHHLEQRFEIGSVPPTALLVALDDVKEPAAAMGALAARMSSEGKRVVLVDATDRRVLGRALGTTKSAVQRVRVGDAPDVALLLPPLPGAPDVDGSLQPTREELASADAVLVLATVEPTTGAWHLRSWASEAVVTVSAGESKAQRINAVAELLDVADVSVISAVLLRTQWADDSVGLPGPGTSVFRRRLGLVPAT